MRYIKGLRIDWEIVEGDISLPDDFMAQDGLTRADILKDWIWHLDYLYGCALIDMEKDFAQIYKGHHGSLDGFNDRWAYALECLGLPEGKRTKEQIIKLMKTDENLKK